MSIILYINVFYDYCQVSYISDLYVILSMNHKLSTTDISRSLSEIENQNWTNKNISSEIYSKEAKLPLSKVLLKRMLIILI